MQWDQTYGGTNIDETFSVVQTSDAGYVLAGYTGFVPYHLTPDCWLIKTDVDGNMQWDQTYGGTNHDAAYCVVNIGDGGYAIIGFTMSFGAGDKDFWLIKTDVDGNMQWDQTYGGMEEDFAHSMIQTSDGGYAIVGHTFSFGAGGKDFWLIKLAPAKIPATVDINPDTLNLKSHGQWITAYIELSKDHNVGNIDVSSILLNDTTNVDPAATTEIGDYDGDSILDLMVKFDRAAVISLIGTVDYSEDTGKSIEVTLVITGKVAGTSFESADIVRVLLKG